MSTSIIIRIMDPWIEYDQVVLYIVRRFGYFSTQYLSNESKHKYQHHICAQRFLPRYSSIALPLAYSELLSKETIHLIYCWELGTEHYALMNAYTLRELKKIVKKNYYLVETIQDKQLKKSWVKALMETQAWGLNIFAMTHNLPDDIYRVIRTFI